MHNNQAFVSRYNFPPKLALPYVPERLITVEAMPATPSGKIQKFRLREMVRQMLQEGKL